MIIAVSGLTEDDQGNKGSAGAGKTEVASHLVKKHGFVEIAFADEIKRICMQLWDFTEEQLWGPSELRSVPDERYPRGYRLDCGCLADGWNKHNDIATKWWAYHILEVCEEHEPEWHRGHFFENPPPKKEYLTPRHALQSIGESVNQVDPLAWTRFAMNVAKQLLTGEYFYMRAVGLLMNKEWEGYSKEIQEAHHKQPAPKGVVISDLRHLTEFKDVQDAGGKCWRKKRNVATLSGAHGRHASEVGLNDVPDGKFDGIFPDGDLGHLRVLIDSCMDVYTGRIIPYDPAQADVPPFLRK